MRTSNLRNLAILSTAVLFTVSCAENTNSSNAQVSTSFKMTGASSAATVAKIKPSIWSLLVNQAYALIPSSIQDSTGLTVNLTEAWTVIKEIEFKSEETAGAEDSEIEVEFQGPYVVDLLSTSPLALDTQLIAEKAIRRIKMKLHKAESLPADAPAGLANNSIYLAGTVGGNAFVFQLDDSTELQIAGPNSFVPGENSELMVEIQLANIFKQINLSTVSNNEVINASSRHAGSNLCDSIDPSAGDIYTCVRKGLEKHANFGCDKDGDDDLDGSDDKVE